MNCKIICTNLAILVLAPFTSAAPKVSTVKLDGATYRPQIVVDAQGTVHMVHGHKTRRGDLFYSKQVKGQQTFSKPIPVTTSPSCAAAFNMTVGKNGRIHVLIRPTARYSKDRLKRQPKFYDLRYMLYCRLNDSGDAFEAERDLSSKTFGFEGVGSILADESGIVHVHWHGLSEAGREPTRQIYTVKSTDEGATFTKPVPIANKVQGACACCSMRGLIGPKGDLYLVYRNSLETDGRKDSYLLRSTDQGKSFKALLLDPWKQAGCPGSTYALAGESGDVYVAWDTKGKLFFTSASGDRKHIPAPVGSRKSRGPALAVNAKGEVLFAWAEATTGRQFATGGDLAWQIFDKSGKPITKKQILAKSIARWSFPAAYAKPNGDFVILYDGVAKK